MLCEGKNSFICHESPTLQVQWTSLGSSIMHEGEKYLPVHTIALMDVEQSENSIYTTVDLRVVENVRLSEAESNVSEMIPIISTTV